MAYTYRYINKQIFPNSISYTLIIEDDETKMVYRMEKTFKCDVNLIDNEYLLAEAKKEINNIENYIPEVIIEEVIPEEI